jgi:predicted nucleic-acid-binding protein
MIGVDTNVLARLFILDPPQSDVAAAFFGARSAADPAFVPLVVMAEFGWVLGKKYGYPAERIAAAIEGLLDSDDFVLEQRDVVAWALDSYVSTNADFTDLLIARVAALAGAPTTATFDRDAAKSIPGMELLQ